MSLVSHEWLHVHAGDLHMQAHTYAPVSRYHSNYEQQSVGSVPVNMVPIHLSTYLGTCLSVRLSIYLSVGLSVCLSVYLSI